MVKRFLLCCLLVIGCLSNIAYSQSNQTAKASSHSSGMTSNLSNIAHSQSNQTLPQAWCRVKLVTSAGTLPSGFMPNLAIGLRSSDGAYKASRTFSGNAVTDTLKSGQITFSNVPTDVPLYVSISYRPSASSQTDTYSKTYQFRYPEVYTIQRLGKSEALELAGYMGDFNIDIVKPKISHSEGY